MLFVVSSDVDIAIIALDVSIDATDDCFDVQKDVDSAIWLDVDFADSLRDEVDVNTAISIDVDFNDFFDARYFFVVSI